MDRRLIEKIADQLQQNAFCPTGQGGGVDPSCGKEGGGIDTSKWSDAQKESWRKAGLLGPKTKGGKSPERISKLVSTAMDNARANGYKFKKSVSDLRIAKDLKKYAADLEDHSPEELEAHVRAYRAAND